MLSSHNLSRPSCVVDIEAATSRLPTFHIFLFFWCSLSSLLEVSMLIFACSEQGRGNRMFRMFYDGAMMYSPVEKHYRCTKY